MKQTNKKKKNTRTRDLGGGLKAVKPAEPDLHGKTAKKVQVAGGSDKKK